MWLSRPLACFACIKSRVPSVALHKPGVVTQVVEIEVQLNCKFEAHLGYVKHCLKNKQHTCLFS